LSAKHASERPAGNALDEGRLWAPLDERCYITPWVF
jgi:hypothetical protein